MIHKYKIFLVFLTAFVMVLSGLCLYLVNSRSTVALNIVFSEKKAKPKVSIITSVYNGDAFIEGFLQDITQQTIFDQCELIMINANSPGHEEQMIRKYMEKYPNIIYVKLEQDPGLYGVWNRAIEISSSEIISNANIDDRSHPEALEIQVKELEAHPDIDLVYTGYLVTKVPNETFLYNHACNQVDPGEFSIQNMVRNLPGPRPVWRKSLHHRYGFFSEIFVSAGDAEMWLRAVNLGAKFKKVPGFYVLYYDNPRGISTDISKKKSVQRKAESHLIYLRYGYLYENFPVK
jgi:glycosyltransferase involved in cell wall biosynthesis